MHEWHSGGGGEVARGRAERVSGSRGGNSGAGAGWRLAVGGGACL